MALNRGIIVGVFKVESWKRATINNFPEFGKNVKKRWGFIGVEAEKKYKIYIYIKEFLTTLFLSKILSDIVGKNKNMYTSEGILKFYKEILTIVGLTKKKY